MAGESAARDARTPLHVRRRGTRIYAIRVERGREAKAARDLTRLLGDAVLEPVFQPKYTGEAKVRGRWVPVERDLLRGYVLAASADPRRLARAVGGSSIPCSVLCDGEGPVPLSGPEAALFAGFGEPGARILPMSRGYKLPDGRICVTEGPLAGREQLIARVDRHKSLAVLRVQVGGEDVRARAGLSLLSVPEGDGALARRLSRRLARAAV